MFVLLVEQGWSFVCMWADVIEGGRTPEAFLFLTHRCVMLGFSFKDASAVFIGIERSRMRNDPMSIISGSRLLSTSMVVHRT